MTGVTAARDYVRNAIQEFMTATCRIERVLPATFNATTGTGSPGSRSTIYEGKCRVWEVSGGAQTVIAEDEIITQNTQLSIPWDVSTIPRRKDEAQILTCTEDSSLVGKRFVIDSSAKAGALRATRRFTVQVQQ